MSEECYGRKFITRRVLFAFLDQFPGYATANEKVNNASRQVFPPFFNSDHGFV